MQSISKSELYSAAQSQGDLAGAAPAAFFLALCPVAAPVPIPEPKAGALRRHRFFFARESEGERERYWLHFGHFVSLQEALKWRDVLSRVYPAAAVRRTSDTAFTPSPGTSSTLTETQVNRLLTASVNVGIPQQTSTPPAQPPQRSRSSQESSQGLEDTLTELRASAWQELELEDTGSRSGVRHLRVEVEQKAAPKKGGKTQRTP